MSACCCPPPWPPLPCPRSPLRPRPRAPPLRRSPIKARTLANGLRVYSIRDTSSSNVSVQVWYDVGSKDDPRGRSGFAHLFEHMMFKATRNLVPEQFDRLTEDVGGFNNASTNDDYTNYYEVVPANHLQRLLWAEAERMSSLVIEPGFFTSERDVVKEELRSRVLAAPYGRLFYLYLPQISYDVHPYARPGHRQHRGSRRRDDRGRARLPRDLLSARQCGAGRRRQFRPGPARPLGRPLFRPDRAPDRRDSARHRARTRAQRRRAPTPSTSRTRRCRPS